MILLTPILQHGLSPNTLTHSSETFYDKEKQNKTKKASNMEIGKYSVTVKLWSIYLCLYKVELKSSTELFQLGPSVNYTSWIINYFTFQILVNHIICSKNTSQEGGFPYAQIACLDTELTSLRSCIGIKTHIFLIQTSYFGALKVQKPGWCTVAQQPTKLGKHTQCKTGRSTTTPSPFLIIQSHKNKHLFNSTC